MPWARAMLLIIISNFNCIKVGYHAYTRGSHFKTSSCHVESRKIKMKLEVTGQDTEEITLTERTLAMLACTFRVSISRSSCCFQSTSKASSCQDAQKYRRRHARDGE
jgi:hypothetical protein